MSSSAPLGKGSLRFVTHFKSADLGGLEIPVEIRHPDLRVARRGVSSQVIANLDPGKYLVVANLPAGQVLTAAVEVSANSQQTVDLRPEESETEPLPAEDEVQHFVAPGLRGAYTSQLQQQSYSRASTRWTIPVASRDLLAHDAAATAIESLGPVASAVSAAPGPAAAPASAEVSWMDVLLAEHDRINENVRPRAAEPAMTAAATLESPSSAPGTLLDQLNVRLLSGNALAARAAASATIGLAISARGNKAADIVIPPAQQPMFLQLLCADQPALNITLPCSAQVGCKVALSIVPGVSEARDLRDVAVEVQLGNAEANALLHFRSAGFAGQAAATVDTEERAISARALLAGKMSDPVAAAVGAYALLQFNRLERLRSWTNNLYTSFTWLPDGAAIYGEHCAREGKHTDALHAFLAIANRGIPYFSEGLTFATQRLRSYIQMRQRDRGPLVAEQFEEARLLLQLLQRYSRQIDAARLIVRFPGLSPSSPGPDPVTAQLLATLESGTIRRLPFQAGRFGAVTAPAAGAAVAAAVPPPARGLEVLGSAAPGPDTARAALIKDTEQRFASREVQRKDHVEKIAAAKQGKGRISDIDDPQRVTLRSQRLLSMPAVREQIDAASAGALETLGTVQSDFLERIIGGDNLLGIAFLDLGSTVARTVGRVHIRDQFQTRGFGTGFLVSPRLLLTNNHVLASPAQARFSMVEFDFQVGLDGRPLTSHEFALQPDAFFATDATLDFTLVAVAAASSTAGAGQPVVQLSQFGFNRLSVEQGKVVIGESINVIQHPDGRPKQVALQQNELVDRLENHLHYRTDTAPGSSGAPLYNNQWEIIGLHHSGVPERDASNQIVSIDGGVWRSDMGEARIKWKANEGVRISSIITRAGQLALTPEQKELLDEFLSPPASVMSPDDAPDLVDTAPPIHTGPANDPLLHHSPADDAFADSPEPPSAPVTAPQSSAQSFTASTGAVTMTIPLTISVQLGSPTPAAPGRAARIPATAVAAPEALHPKKPILDLNYGNRIGYRADFLSAQLQVPLPQVTREPEVAPVIGAQGSVLAYEHFSIVMHRQRRLAIYTASNVDGSDAARRPDPSRKYSRAALGGFGPNDIEAWVSEPRLGAQYQVPDIFYMKDRGAFDRGHLVRRDDVCFGASYAQVQRANGDTYHMTNCSPQVMGYNRSDSGGDNWGDLENVVLSQAKAERYCLVAGPVFKKQDRIFRGSGTNGPMTLKIPRSYWKVVVAVKSGALQAFAFVLEQDLSAVSFESTFPESQVIDDPRVLEFLPPPEFTRVMVPLRTLEAKLGGLLQFPAALHAADQYQLESGMEVARSSRTQRLS